MAVQYPDFIKKFRNRNFESMFVYFFPVGSQSSSDAGEASQPVSQGLNLDPDIIKAECSEHLAKFGLSPLVTGARTVAAKAQYAKRKLDDVHDIVSKKVCLALDIEIEDVNKQVDKSKPKDADLMAILSAVKLKLAKGVNRKEKIRLLTLCPLSWTIEESHKYFCVSRYYIRAARKVRRDYGVLGDMPHVKGWKLPDTTKQLVLDFYNDDEYSRIMPGKKDSISVSGVHMQKRLLLINLKELYHLFKEKYKHLKLKIGLSTFCALRPKWCVIAGSSGTHNVCVCIYHQNCKLKLKALGINEHLKDLLPMFVCDTSSKSCMLGLCVKCPSTEDIAAKLKEKLKSKMQAQHLVEEQGELEETEEIEDIFEEEINTEELFLDDTIKYKEWTKTDGSDLVSKECKVRELIDLLARAIKKLIPHHFVSVDQAAFLKKYKEEMSQNQAVILMDFSMNYSCLIQDASQSYHWSKKGVTVHPIVIYYKDANNDLKNDNLCFISEDVTHDVSMVKLMQEKTMAYIKEKLPQVTEVMYMTDGCAGQYKNCFSFLNLCKHFEWYGIKASWCFFATSHGKSPCDGIGGTIKREATKASLQRLYGDYIKDADSLFKFCKENLSKTITFFQILASDLKVERAQAETRKAVTVPGTRTFHHFTPISGTFLKTHLSYGHSQ